MSGENNASATKAPMLEGMHYASLRHEMKLGPRPQAATPDTDWGVQTGFEIPAVRKPSAQSKAAMDSLFKDALSPNAPAIADLRDGILARCRKARAQHLRRRRACPKRRAVEEELRSTVEDMS